MKELIGYRYLATRGGYVANAENRQIKLESEISTKLEVGETGSPIWAVSKPDTIFTGWNDGVKSNPRTDVGHKGDYPEKVVLANFRMKAPWWRRFVVWFKKWW